jgi:hypothetical protein
MNWNDLAGKVIGLGAPILGGALGGPLGAAAGENPDRCAGRARVDASRGQHQRSSRPSIRMRRLPPHSMRKVNGSPHWPKSARCRWLRRARRNVRRWQAAIGCRNAGAQSMRWNFCLLNARRSRSRCCMRCGSAMMPVLMALPNVRPSHGVFWRAFRRSGRLYHRPHKGKQASVAGELPPTVVGNCSRRSRRTRRTDEPFIRHSPACF